MQNISAERAAPLSAFAEGVFWSWNRLADRNGANEHVEKTLWQR